MENQSHQQPATPEKVWATLDRITEKQEKAAKEMEAQREEFKRLQKEARRRMKKLEGLFTSQWGALMERLVEGDLVPLLQARGITVRYTHTRMQGRRNGCIAHSEWAGDRTGFHG